MLVVELHGFSMSSTREDKEPDYRLRGCHRQGFEILEDVKEQYVAPSGKIAQHFLQPGVTIRAGGGGLLYGSGEDYRDYKLRNSRT